MWRRAAACGIAIIRKGIAPQFSGNFVLPNNAPFFSYNFHSCSHKDRPFSSKPRVDFSSINDVEDALCLFRDMVRMPPPFCFSIQKAVSCCCQDEHYSVALSLFDEMRQLGVPVEITMNNAINCYCLLNRVDFGFAVLGTFFKRGCEPNVTTFTFLIKGLFLVGEIAEAEKLFKKVLSEKLCEPDEIMYVIVLNGLSKAGHILAARDLLGHFENLSCKPNVHVYSAVIDGLCKHNMADDALHLLSRMIEKGISPNVVTYNSVIQGLCDVGMVEEAENVFEIMVQRNICPNIVTCNALIDDIAYEGKWGRVDEAWHLFMEISCKGLQYDTISYSTMIHGLFCKDRFADGWKLFNDMEARGVMPNLQTFTILLDGLCRTQQIAQALSFLRMMEDTGVKPDIIAYAIAIDGLCKGGKLDIARDLFNQLPSKGFSERNELYNAMPFMEEMYKRGFLVDASTTSMLLDQLQRKGKDDILLEHIKKVVPKNEDLSGF
ncbi:UNVERIFIED_CONTAM: hypothetical protein Scaly_0812600 [Sesamum calycinum]|uniref:Pentatricopeptide repeat protein n=1 Tax=Sesamum calycinum TaxID=2727403 RepID=A0AAW2R9T9_9LAMI